MARTKHTQRRKRHHRGGDPPEEPPTKEPPTKEPSMWDNMSTSVGDFTKQVTGSTEEAAPTASVEQSAGRKKRRCLRGGYAGSVKYPGVATYATAVGGRRRRHKGGSHGVGVAAYASPYTQGGGKRRRRRTRRRHYKK
jgi:hypothetical protein